MNTVLYISDFNDMQFLVASLRSLRYFDNKIKVFILSDRVPNSVVNMQLHRFQAEVVVCKKVFDTVFANISNHIINRWSNLVFYRLLIPFIPQLCEYDRILYVDTDTMFIKDFKFLMDMPMDYMYGMFYEEHHCEKYGKWLHERLLAAYDLVRRHNYAFMRISQTYYNAGVVLFNVKAMTENADKWKNAVSLFDKIFDNEVFVHNEQMFLNIFFKFDEFRSELWDVNSKTITDKTVIAHYYSADLKHKRCGYLNTLMAILRKDKKLYDYIAAEIFK